MSTQFVLMYHPALGNRQATVPLQAVDDYAATGWLLVDPEVTPPASSVPYTTVAQVASQASDGNTPIGGALRAAFGSSAGELADRPAASTTAERWYFATDVDGGTLYRNTGTSWVQVAGSVAAPGPVMARRTTAATRNNTATLAADDQLVVPVLAGWAYTLMSCVMYQASTTADLLIGWSAPSGSSLDWTPNALPVSSSGNTGSIQRNVAGMGGQVICGGNGAASVVATPSGLLTAGADGLFSLRWAQAVAEVSDASIRAGSWLRLEPVA